MQKRLIVCCDGTWQTLESTYPTNVVKIAQGVKTFDSRGIPQVIYYDEGLGNANKIDAFLGGSFAVGLSENVQQAYRFLCFNYDPGDEIYLFGFSRGAYTVRSLVGLMSCCGLVGRSHVRKTPEAYEIYRELDKATRIRKGKEFQQKYSYSQPAKITLLGCWDTVGSVGIPDIIPFWSLDRDINKKYGFHDTDLSPIIENAIHALSIDEDRKVFQPTFMQQKPENTKQRLRQVWFPGVHSSVGGGTQAYRGQSNITLSWMLDIIQNDFKLGLEFDRSQMEDSNAIDPLVNFSTANEATGIRKFVWKLTGIKLRDIETIDPEPIFHESVKKRWQGRSDYRPDNLKPFKTQFE
ncbi:MAG: DUF2235 domain-containing protein [Cyanobacteria bacterium P01_E01_bin.42]